MGSDTHPEVLFLAALELAKTLENQAEFFLFASEDSFTKQTPSHVHKVFAKEVITMDEAPLHAVRTKKEASMCLGIRYLKEQTIDAFISFGNTGALMASAKMILKMLPSIDRPALLALLPAKQSEVAVLDVGANSSYKAQHLAQFAQMGIAYQKSRGIKDPKVGLLNIGAESMKGTPLLREAYSKLEELNSSFVGNIEGRHALGSEIDVLVTDGFTGNVFLKTAEGIANVILEELKAPAFKDGLSVRCRAAMTALKHHLTYSEYPGALLCGVQGIVMKCHGEFSNLALSSTVKAAIRLVQHRFLDQIKAQLNII